MERVLYILILFASYLPVQSFSQEVIHQRFPSMDTETAEGKTFTLPQDTKGRITLIGLAYSKKSEDDLTTWMNPLFNAFIRQKINNTGLFSDLAHDIDVYFVPMFTGINAAAKGMAKRKAIQHLDSRLLPFILFYQGKLKPYKEALAFEKRDVPYFFLLDKEGNIIHATSGVYSDKKMEDIEDMISKF